ncbi:uncharacterized protein LOC112159848 [Oryzias melastigma]|uniref:uncharacterized protein LOC112159848 n=1 Tax=Oryzias melastigma TaxID=30732 RepID=UPI00168CD94E|nr:uncharacterized protein LOC112159848 [Oryzias melastigma]
MNALVEFEISDVQLGDAGFYRCRVQGTPVYSDYYVEVFEVSGYSEQTPHFTPTTTIKAPNSSTDLPDSTGPVLAQDRSDSSRASRGLSLPLIAVVSITVMVLVTAVIGAVYCRVKARSKQSDMCKETRCESLKQDASEENGIVYTTVDFTVQRKPEEVYANLQVHRTQAGGPGAEHDGTVEYSVLAI